MPGPKKANSAFLKSYVRVFNLVTQTIVLIILGAFGGRELDLFFFPGKHILTVILILVATIIAFYLFYKTLINNDLK